VKSIRVQNHSKIEKMLVLQEVQGLSEGSNAQQTTYLYQRILH